MRYCRLFADIYVVHPDTQLETLLPHHHTVVRPRAVLDLWCICALLGHGDGIQQDQSQCIVLSWRFHVAAYESLLGICFVSTNMASKHVECKGTKQS